VVLKYNLIANSIGQIWVALMGIAFLPLYIKYLGIEAYGVIGFFAILQGIFNLLDMGMSPTVSREMSRFIGKERSKNWIGNFFFSIECIVLLVCILVFALVFFISSWIASDWLKPTTIPLEDLTQVISLMGLVIGLRLIEGIYRGAILGLQQHVTFNIINIISATLRWGGAVIVLAYISNTLFSFFIWQGLCSFLTLLILRTTSYKFLKIEISEAKFSIEHLKECWIFAIGMVAISLSVVGITLIDKIIISKLLSLEDFGYYSLAVSASLGLTFVASPIAQSFLPKLTELFSLNNTNDFSAKFHSGAQLISVFLGTAGAIMIVFSDYILKLWTQDNIIASEVSPTLSVLALGVLINGLMVMPYIAQISTGWTKLTNFMNYISIIFLIPLLIIYVNKYGAIGAALVIVVINLINFLVSQNFMFSRILKGERFKWYINDTFKPIFMALFLSLLVRYFYSDIESNLGMIIVLIKASIFSFIFSALSANILRQKCYTFLKFKFEKI
jgi:O-antigen/teichoic acid export membrane protein